MKNSFKLFAAISRAAAIRNIVIIAVIGFSMTACGGDSSDTDKDTTPDLTGTITISPSGAIDIHTEITANYSGPETITTYQWKRSGNNVGSNSNKFTPTTAGTYTVTVSAEGFKNKTSDTIAVTDPASLIISETISEQISKQLGEQAGTKEDPATLVLSFDLGDMPSSDSGWRQLLTAINAGNKYVILDLSSCTMTGTEFNPVSSAQTGKSRIVEIIMPETAESITSGAYPNYTFRYFSALKSIGGENVISIGIYAFRDCTALENVSFPVAENIGNYAFRDCTSLTEVEFPTAIVIGRDAFSGCTKLVSASFPVLITIGDSDIMGGAFYKTGLTAVNFPELIIIGNNALSDCTKLNTVSFPKATSIGEGAFFNCGKLTEVTIPKAESIGNSAFYDCTDLEEVSFPNATIIDIAAFSGCSGLILVDIPIATSMGSKAFQNCIKLTEVNFPLITNIGGYAFEGCIKLASVNFPAAEDFGHEVFKDTGNHNFTINLGHIAPGALGSKIFSDVTRTVYVLIPENAEGYTPFTTDNIDIITGGSTSTLWANGLRGLGWRGSSGLGNWIESDLRKNVTVVFQYISE